jgi:hypothetical protein
MAYKERIEFVRPLTPVGIKLKELEERIGAIEHSLSPLNEGEELEPTKTIELTEDEIINAFRSSVEALLELESIPKQPLTNLIMNNFIYFLNKLNGK